MAKLTTTDLLNSNKVNPASELKTQKEAKNLALKVFEGTAVEQSRNQRFQSPKNVGSITRLFFD